MTEILYSVAITTVVISIIIAVFGVVKERLKKLSSVQLKIDFAEKKPNKQLKPPTSKS